MATFTFGSLAARTTPDPVVNWRATATEEDVIVESWGEGFLFGAVMIMACITVANMRKGVFLHKLILVELLLNMLHGTFCFMGFKGYGWYLSGTAALLYTSMWVHNWVSWLKIRPFFREKTSICSTRTSWWITRVYLVTLGMSIVPLTFQMVNNFLFFNNINDRYLAFRPFETVMRDPWWVFVCVVLLHVIRKSYGASTWGLIKFAPRFGILLAAILLAMLFTVLDIMASVHTSWFGSTDGINPWWKLYLVFKCLTDTIMLDDFKTELDRLSAKMMGGFAARSASLPISLHSQHNTIFADSDALTIGTIATPDYVHVKSEGGYGHKAEVRHVEQMV